MGKKLLFLPTFHAPILYKVCLVSSLWLQSVND